MPQCSAPGAGASAASINYYFGSKEGLMEATMRHLLRKLRKAMVEGLRAFRPLPACHEIVDRIFVLVDGIAINALLDPKRWTRARQRTVLREGVEDALARH